MTIKITIRNEDALDTRAVQIIQHGNPVTASQILAGQEISYTLHSGNDVLLKEVDLTQLLNAESEEAPTS